MKNLILKFLFLFYRYYDKGSTKSIAYTSALIALMMVLFLNIFLIIIIAGVNIRHYVFSYAIPISVKYLIGFIIFIPIFFTLKHFFKKEDVLKIEMDTITMRKGYLIIIVYIITSMLLLAAII